MPDVVRTTWERCGEEIINAREIVRGSMRLWRTYAGKGYYQNAAGQTHEFAGISDVAIAFEDRWKCGERSVFTV